MNTPRTKIWPHALRWFLALVLIWAALGKIANPHEFYGSLLGYQLPLPGGLARTAAIVLPWLEFLCGVLLVCGVARGGALIWTTALFTFFTLITASAWMRGLTIDCGCLDLRILGIAKESPLAKSLETPAAAFFRALVLSALAWSLLLRERHRAAT